MAQSMLIYKLLRTQIINVCTCICVIMSRLYGDM